MIVASGDQTGFKTRHMKYTNFPSLYGKWNASVLSCDKYTLDDGFLNSNITIINKSGLDPMEHNIPEMASKFYSQQRMYLNSSLFL